MSSIKELPKIDRPREKALRYGINTLSDCELMALLLNSGYKGNNVIEISTSLLNKYGGIVGLLNVPINELKKNKGIKNVGALKISLICEFYKRICEKANETNEIQIDDEYLYNKYKSKFYLANQEHLILIILNRKKRIIFEDTLYKSNANILIYDFNDIYKQMVKYEGYYFYLIHNHPNGDCSPSKQDKIATEEIAILAKKHKLTLLDHLIIGEDSYYSFRKMKKITISY